MPITTYTPEEVEQLLRAERRATVRAVLDEIAPRLMPFLDTVETRAGFKEVMTTREAADYAGVKRKTIHEWVKHGLPATDRGGSAGFVFRKADLDEWLTRDEA